MLFIDTTRFTRGDRLLSFFVIGEVGKIAADEEKSPELSGVDYSLIGEGDYRKSCLGDALL